LNDKNSFLDERGFSPIGQVVEGMDVVERFYSGYGETVEFDPSGEGPDQGLIQSEGNEYLQSSYPKLSYYSKVQFLYGRPIEFTAENLDGEPGETGTFIVLTRPDWAPIGAGRFETLVSEGFFEECRVFRVLPGFIAQFGINGDPDVQAKWRSNYLEDEPVAVSNSRGTISFTSYGRPGSRTTQLFINLKRNSFLDEQGFSPIGQVVEGMDVVERFYSGYGDTVDFDPLGEGPDQGLIQSEGNEYLQSSYPKLSYFSMVQFL
ncbi:hypothetical protein THAOC_06221, partial [Thalassiosira oceanica]